jgi:uncharacterized protein Veg
MSYVIIDNKIRTQYGDTLRITYDNDRNIKIQRNDEVGEVVPSIQWYLVRNFKTLVTEEIHFLIGFNVIRTNLQAQMDSNVDKINELLKGM